MDSNQRRAFFRNALLAAWAMVTLVLFFCVILLANEMIKRGYNPVETATIQKPASGGEQVDALPTESRQVPIYFASPSGLLQAELRPIAFSDYTVDNCRAALEALIKGPPQEGLQEVLAKDTKFNALYLLSDGELVIDFSLQNQVLAAAKSVSAEALTVYGIVNTLTQGALKGKDGVAVKSVRFLVGGSTPPENVSMHIDLSKPILPDERWILRGAERQAGNA